jgi:hypothetical protein
MMEDAITLQAGSPEGEAAYRKPSPMKKQGLQQEPRRAGGFYLV